MIIIVDPETTFRARVKEQLGRPIDAIELDQLRQVSGALAERGPEGSVVLIGPHVKSAASLAFASQTQETAPDVCVVIVSATVNSALLQDALRAGVRDVLADSFSPAQLKETIARAGALSRNVRDRAVPSTIDITDPEEHHVVTVLSSKGGVGKSFVSSNLAVVLARRGYDVALVDLDLSSGDLGVMLKLFPARTLYDAIQDLDRLDEEALRGYLEPHESRVSLLAAPQEPGMSESISGESVQAILRKLRKAYRYVVVGTPPMFNDHVLAAIDESDVMVAVTTMDVPSIKNIRLALQTLEMLGVPRERLRMVLNRADSKVGLNIPEVEKTLMTNVDLAVPSSREVPLSINRGVAIAAELPKSGVANALGRLADSIIQHSGKPVANGNNNNGHRFHIGRKR